MNLDPAKINQADFIWDPTKETGLYFKVHAISTEFTAKKHGGEKGVPFRIQIETYSHNDGENKLLHAASCQIKVFKVGQRGRVHGVMCVKWNKYLVNFDRVMLNFGPAVGTTWYNHTGVKRYPRCLLLHIHITQCL